MTATKTPKVAKKKLLSPIWILPITAFLLGAWLLASYIRERGTDIEIHFPSANGIEANKTLVRYQGLVVGQVNKVELDDKGGVEVTVKMSHQVDDLLRRGTQFWLVTPKASLTGIEGLDALFSGNYITMSPGEGARRTRFNGSFEAPLLAAQNGGLTIELLADRRGSLDVGSGVYFQQIQVGQILKYELEQDSHQVRLTAVIESKFRSLVRENSRFWNTSGARFNAGLDGVNVEVDSLATLLAGGISFSSPEAGEEAGAGTVFPLYDDRQSAQPSFMVTFTADNAESLRVGTPIQHRGLKLGEVEKLVLGEDNVTLSARILGDYRHLFNDGSRFWRAGAELGLDGVKHLDTLIFGDFIALLPGNGEPTDSFELNDQRPLTPGEGQLVHLTQSSAEGLSVGAPLLYRGFPVGEILQLSLTKGGIEATAWVSAPYHQLVKTNSRFWRHSGVAIEADLSGINVQSAPLMNLVKGGISFSTGSADNAEESQVFPIFKSRSEALEGPPISVTLTADTLNGLSVGAPLYFRELEVGKVANLRLKGDAFEVELAVEPAHQNLINERARFWHQSHIKVEGSLAGVAIQAGPLPQLLRGGLGFDHLEQSAQRDRHIYADRQSALSPSASLQLFTDANARIGANAEIRYLGHAIGKIESVSLSEDLQHQVLNAHLEPKWQSHFLRQDARYFLVSADISLAGAKNVETLLTGNYIAALPGNKDKMEDRFTLLKEAPVQLPFENGLRLVLNQTRLGSLKIGSPVLYRQMKVGEVVHTRLAQDGASVDIEVQFDPRYQHLVNRSSHFWNASGLYMDVGLFSGAQIATESLETLLIGGIAFATETTANDQLSDGDRFPLAQRPDPDWLDWQPRF
ncbi:MCE family protein [Marinobacter hydrocarbonoclasticus]|nr:MCE family protein [Marinobacter nauticus]